MFGGAGQRSLAERPTILLVGGLDGVSTAGAEAVLRVTDELLGAPERLPAGVAFLAVPWANPDGLARQQVDGTGGGRNDLAHDDDGDGAVDEDGPDDLNGDGLITTMLLADPEGGWLLTDDEPALPKRASSAAGEQGAYRWLSEGKDDDGDGLYNEDGLGGVVVGKNFPHAFTMWTSDSGRWAASTSERATAPRTSDSSAV